jgi:hypothetical protein
VTRRCNGLVKLARFSETFLEAFFAARVLLLQSPLTNLTRQRGRAPRGQRLVAPVPYGHWKTSTFVAGLRTSGLTAPFVLDGAMNGEAFVAYVEQVLAPTLSPGDIVIIGQS